MSTAKGGQFSDWVRYASLMHVECFLSLLVRTCEDSFVTGVGEKKVRCRVPEADKWVNSSRILSPDSQDIEISA